MMLFALRAGVPFFDLRAFRECVAYARDRDALVGEDLLREMVEAFRTLTDSVGSEGATRLREVEDRLETYYLGLRLSLQAGTPGVDRFRPGDLTAAVEQLAGLARQRASDRVREVLAAVDRGLTAVAAFYTSSLARGRQMAERTVALIDQLRDDRAALVVGGFHVRSVTRAFEDFRALSWTVIIPTTSLRTPYFLA
jgi:hypothetical protein